MLPTELGYALAPSRKGETSAVIYEPDHRLLLGEKTTYALSLSHGRLRTGGNVEGISIPRDKPKKLSEFPEDFRKLVEDFIKRIG
jgi:hypothetical protein